MNSETFTIMIHNIPTLVCKPRNLIAPTPCLLWFHGGGYFFGKKEWSLTRCQYLVEQYGITLFSPDYRLSVLHPFPAALEDAYTILTYLKENANELNIRSDQIIVGGDSAGGGLCVSLCMLARDKNEIKIAYQFPMYPMLDNFDTETSKNNHGKGWDTRRNHFAWFLYLRHNVHKKVSPYAAPARQTDYSNLPPTYTLVGDGEPFYQETLTYIKNLQKAGVEAKVDIYHTNIHGFDTDYPDLPVSKEANSTFYQQFEYAIQNCFAPQIV